jgi:SAM-dependent methyltransferase
MSTGDVTAGGWDQADPANQAMVAQRDDALRSHLERLGRPVRRALDLGCGRGQALRTFGLAGVGVDVSVLRLRLAPGPVAQADAARLPFPAAAFDVVLAVNVLSSIPAEAHRREVVAELCRVLTGDGVVLWYDQRWPNPGNRGTRPVTRQHLRQLLPSAAFDLEPITVAPAVARALPRRYDRLHGLRPLRSHLVGTIRPGP